MEIHVPPGIPTLGLLDVNLDSFNMSLSASACEGNNCTILPMGSFQTPATRLKLGKNEVTWDIGATLTDAAILLNDFIVPLFMDHKTVNLKLSGDDVSMHLRFAHVLPIPIKRLRLEKTLSCKMLGMSEAKDMPEEICHSAHVGEGRRLDSSQGYSIRCTPHSAGVSASAEIVV